MDVDITTDMLCMACSRLLFLYTGFNTNKAGILEQLVWSWEFFNSTDTRVSFRKNTTCYLFKDLRSETLDKLRHDLNTTIKHNVHNHSEKGVVSLKVMYNVLASVLQDYLWDTPTIMSPFVRKIPKRGKSSDVTIKDKVVNNIFIISKSFYDITSNYEMGGVNGRSLGQCFKEELFPDAVCSQLQNKNIKLFTIWQDNYDFDQRMVR